MKFWGLIKGRHLFTTGNLEALGLSEMTLLHAVGFFTIKICAVRVICVFQ
jgi:hypothetical protein